MTDALLVVLSVIVAASIVILVAALAYFAREAWFELRR